MGLVYNKKDKHDLVVLADQELENIEAEHCNFYIVTPIVTVDDDETSPASGSTNDTHESRQK